MQGSEGDFLVGFRFLLGVPDPFLLPNLRDLLRFPKADLLKVDFGVQVIWQMEIHR